MPLLGPDNGLLEVHTFREGLAQRAGHDLVIAVTAWRAEVETDAEGAVAAGRLEADPRSFEVREGRNGVKPLSDADVREIGRTIDRKVLRGLPIEFTSTAVEARGGGASVRGELTMAGTTRPLALELEVEAGRLAGLVSLRQSDWGIEPYRAFMGALRVRDIVEVHLEAHL